MTKAQRWGWIVALVATTGAGLVLTFLLSVATNNRQFYEQHFTWLFWVNVVIASLLALVIVLAVAAYLGHVGPHLWLGSLKLGPWLLHPLVLLYAISGTLMISKTLRIPKP